MKLLLDVGNTRCKWRLVDAGVTVDSGVLGDSLLLDAALAGVPASVQVHGCCVASPALQHHLEEQSQTRWQTPVQWLTVSAECCGLRNRYVSPGLGPDRWASAIAALQVVRGTDFPVALAVNAGTALTVDVVTAGGDFLGGTIGAGLALMRSALAQGTARLPLAHGEIVDIPRTTDAAILTGTLDAACGAVERLAARVDQPVLVLLSGGDAPVLKEHLPLPAQTVENLVLDGLQVITR